MELHSKAIFLSQKTLGERQAVVRVFTKDHGLLSGVIQKYKNAKNTASYQPGDHVKIFWRARLEEHLGKMHLEHENQQYTQSLLLSGHALQALVSLCGLLQKSLSERTSEPTLYGSTVVCLSKFSSKNWLFAYLEWEKSFLENMGFGIDLSCCAAEGCEETDLAYLSPKTGHGICAKHAEPYLSKVMKLPNFWQTASLKTLSANVEELILGFTITEHFIRREILHEDQSLLDFRRNMLQSAMKNWSVSS